MNTQGTMVWPDWATQIFEEHKINPKKLTNLSSIKKMVIGLHAMASNPTSSKTAKELLLNQQDVVRYLERQKEDPSLIFKVEDNRSSASTIGAISDAYFILNNDNNSFNNRDDNTREEEEEGDDHQEEDQYGMKRNRKQETIYSRDPQNMKSLSALNPSNNSALGGLVAKSNLIQERKESNHNDTKNSSKPKGTGAPSQAAVLSSLSGLINLIQNKKTSSSSSIKNEQSTSLKSSNSSNIQSLTTTNITNYNKSNLESESEPPLKKVKTENQSDLDIVIKKESMEVDDDLLNLKKVKKEIDESTEASLLSPRDESDFTDDETKVSKDEKKSPSENTQGNSKSGDNSEKSDIVCFGMIKSQMPNVQHSILHSCIGNAKMIEVFLYAEPTGNPNIYALRIESSDGRKIGYAEKKLCVVLSPLLKHLRIDGSIPKPPTAVATAQLHLTLFGSRKMVQELGQYLADQKIFLSPSASSGSVPYVNPHAGLVSNRQDTVHMGHTTKSVDEVKSQIDYIYNTLVSAEDLEQMEPDQRLVTPLYPHQKQALHFMMRCEHPEENNGGGLWKKQLNGNYENLITGEFVHGTPKFHRGGILADDMGLGKTIEVISLMLKTHNKSGDWVQEVKMKGLKEDVTKLDFDPSLIPAKGTMIVCPLSTVSNWEDQIQTHVRRGALSIYVYHGASRCQDPRVLSKFNVILTTYNVLSLEYGKDLRNAKRTSTDNKHSSKGSMSSILHRMHWYRVVLDEAHIIKDSNTGQSRAAYALSAERKWCLTGTPIQNKLEDIYSLVNFLNVQPFCSKIAWTNYITKALKMRAPSGGNIGVARLQTLMKAVTLRRTKNSKIHGKPILNLPGRHDTIHYLALDHTEQTLYDRASAQAQQVFQDLVEAGSVMRNYVHLLELILKLRQICTHPLLCKNYEELLKEDASTIKWNMERAIHLFSLLKDSGDEDCVSCGVFVDGIEFTPHISRCGHMHCDNCYRTGWSKGSHITCGMCGTDLMKSDIIQVTEAEGDEDQASLRKISNSSGSDGMSRLSPGMVNSSKLTALLEDLTTAKQEALGKGDGPVKSVIFSQWTQMLDLIEKPLIKAGYRMVRLDGRMSRPERTNALDRFKRDSSVTIMLVSLKAGGVGLNLTSANRVYIMEPYWNPAIEQQAIDRVHRLGQTREVTTVRFIVTGTIEDSILELQRKKLALAQMTFKEEETVDLSTIDRRKKMKRGELKKDKQALQNERMNDLRMLFNLKNNETATIPAE